MRQMNFDTIVVGSGCAGLNAIDTLSLHGRKNIALVTEGFYKGTSRNTGSDKQTYYKLSLCGGENDSIQALAKTLSSGGSVDEEVALAEAASSVRCFMKLVNLGLDFPTDKYGQFVGYKTDHDPLQRATSAGPLTSKYMCEVLEKEIRSKDVTILDDYSVVRLVVVSGVVTGMIAYYMDEPVYLKCNHVIWCTGGPSGIYEDVVYPESQRGMTGLALAEGCKAVNLQHWQYGIASTKFRWNLSGTYQQVLPSYVSVDEQGVEREFLFGKGYSEEEVLANIFLKGYQWPFDSRKMDGSSWVDLQVYKESVEKQRKVYLDYRKNSSFLASDLSNIGEEAYSYLEKSQALFGTPIERLQKMNPLAIELYKTNGIDLYHERLEIKVCAQNHNGGLLVDASWKTNLENFYVCGEAAGTFGPYRPGGSALNSTQVSSLRAVQDIVFTTKESNDFSLSKDEMKVLSDFQALADRLKRSGGILAEDILRPCMKGMSTYAGFRRIPVKMQELLGDVEKALASYFEKVQVNPKKSIAEVFTTYDSLITTSVVLQAMIEAASQEGSLGGSIIVNDDEIVAPSPAKENRRLVSSLEGCAFEDLIPKVFEDVWFEKNWEEHRTKRKVKG